MITGGYSKEAREKPLHGYQEYAVKWALDRIFVQKCKGAALFLDPGLGKTRTTLTILDTLFKFDEIKRALIVAPLRPVYTVWPLEIERWGFPQTYAILHQQVAKAMMYNLQIEITNFAGLDKIKDIKNRWDLIAVDESTFAKTWKTRRSRNIRKMIKTIPRRLILTGTPASNSLADLHAQMYIVDDGESLGHNATVFHERFCYQGGFRGRQWKVRETVAAEIEKAIRGKALRMQAEDFLDMPKKIENIVWCKMPDSATSKYRQLKRDLYAELQHEGVSVGVLAKNAASAYSKCKQFANGLVYNTLEDGTKESYFAHDEKRKALYELHEELAGKPLLIFYWFTHDREFIMKGKGSPFRNCPIIAGKMKIQDVQQIIAEWNTNKHHAIICQWAATSHGLNMQYGKCADIACFGLTESLDICDQAIRRVYRQGVQAEQIRIHKFLTLDTVELVMNERLDGKHQTQSAFLNALKQHARG